MTRPAAMGAAALAALALAACTTTKPAAPAAPALALVQPPPAAAPAPPLVIKVPVAVKQACVPHALPPPPRYPDSDAALREAGGAADRYQLMAAGRILRAKRLAMLERVVESCR